MSPEEAERWIVNLICNARLDAKIDSKLVRPFFNVPKQLQFKFFQVFLHCNNTNNREPFLSDFVVPIRMGILCYGVLSLHVLAYTLQQLSVISKSPPSSSE